MALGEPEQLLKFLAVKAQHHLAVDYRNGCGAHPQVQKLLQRLLVFPNVLGDELHTLLRKELFLLIAGLSPGLGIHNHLFCHPCLPSGLSRCAPIRVARCLGRTTGDDPESRSVA